AIMKDRDVALDTMAREELGLDPGQLGSPWSAALSSLLAFAIGAIVVVLPYLFGSGHAALVFAIAFAGLAPFCRRRGHRGAERARRIAFGGAPIAHRRHGRPAGLRDRAPAG